jgi:hypothetical protein
MPYLSKPKADGTFKDDILVRILPPFLNYNQARTTFNLKAKKS